MSPPARIPHTLADARAQRAEEELRELKCRLREAIGHGYRLPLDVVEMVK